MVNLLAIADITQEAPTSKVVCSSPELGKNSPTSKTGSEKQYFTQYEKLTEQISSYYEEQLDIITNILDRAKNHEEFLRDTHRISSFAVVDDKESDNVTRKPTSKCKCHGKEQLKENMYKVVIQTEKSRRTEYFCSEKDYLFYLENLEYRPKFEALTFEILEQRTYNTAFKKDSEALGKIYGFKLMYEYIQENHLDLTMAMYKQFNNEYSKIKYFMAILKNNLTDYKNNMDMFKEEHKVVKVQEQDIPIERTTRKKRETKRSLNDIFNGVG